MACFIRERFRFLFRIHFVSHEKKIGPDYIMAVNFRGVLGVRRAFEFLGSKAARCHSDMPMDGMEGKEAL